MIILFLGRWHLQLVRAIYLFVTWQHLSSESIMGLVKTRRLTAMWKQQRAEAGGEADGNAQEWHLATTTWFTQFVK